MNRNNLYLQFYRKFKQATLDAVKPNIFLTLSGGWDTRLIAGILAENNLCLPTITWGDLFERLVAAKIASIVNFEHYVIDSDFGAEKLYSVWRKLKQKGCEYFLSGMLFDEICGSWTGIKAKTFNEFEHVQTTGLDAKHKQLEEFNKTKYPEWVSPLMSPTIKEFLESIPWQFRKAKQIQRWILRNKFPKLWRIPYANSMLLPNSLPYQLHGSVSIVVREKIKPRLKANNRTVN